MRCVRKENTNVRAYRIGCREPYPFWLRKAIACGDITIEENVGGLVDVCSFYWNGKKQYFYEDDWLIKTPEGPIMPVIKEKFILLYERQLTIEEQCYIDLSHYRRV